MRRAIFGKRVKQIAVILLVGLMMSGVFFSLISAEKRSTLDKNSNKTEVESKIESLYQGKQEKKLVSDNRLSNLAECTSSSSIFSTVYQNGGEAYSTTPSSNDTFSAFVIENETVCKSVLSENSRIIIQFNDESLTAYVAKSKKNYASVTYQEINDYQKHLINTHNLLKNDLQKRGVEINIGREYTYVFNGIAATVSQKDIKEIRSLSYVKAVYPDQEVNICLDESVPLINAEDVWKMQNSTGAYVTGKDIVIAIIDTGIDYTHPDLGNGFGPNYKVIGGYDFVNNDNDPMDDNGHGTHCAGIVAGIGYASGGKYTGVAPDAKLIAYKVLNEKGSGSMSNVIAGIERACDPDQNLSTDDAVDVISISLGGYGDPSDPVSQAVDNAFDLGVVVVAAAGNSGPTYKTIISPGCARKALTVGATDKTDAIAYWSSRGPVIYNRETLIKPDVLAPGVDIVSALANGTDMYGDGQHFVDTFYYKASGTSMATPHVAGAAALLLQLHRGWSPEKIKTSLMNTAIDLNYTLYEQGTGRIDAFRVANSNLTATPSSISLGVMNPSSNSTIILHNTGQFIINANLSVTCVLGANKDFTTVFENPQQVNYVILDISVVSIQPGSNSTVSLYFTTSLNALEGHYWGKVVIQNGTLNNTVPFSFKLTYDIFLSCVNPYQTINPSGNQEYNITVSNTGNLNDTYNFTVGIPEVWNAVILDEVGNAITSLSLVYMTSAEIFLNVSNMNTCGDCLFTATSQGNLSVRYILYCGIFNLILENLTISTVKSYQDTFILANNLTVANGGNLTLNNSSIKINCSYNWQYGVKAENGGKLYIYDSKITSAHPDYHYFFTILSKAKMKMENSKIHNCGYTEVIYSPPLVGITLYTGLEIYSNDVTINNCLVSNNSIGIYSQDCNPAITNSTITSNYYNIYCHNSSPIIKNNNISNTMESMEGLPFAGGFYGRGISCNWHSNGTLDSNNVSDNNGYGIFLSYSSPMLINNILNDNKCGVFIGYDSKETIPKMSNNFVNGVDLQQCYYYNQSNLVIDGENSDSGREEGYIGAVTLQGLITLYDCTNVTIKNCDLSNNWYYTQEIYYNWGAGIWAERSNVTIENNNLSNNSQGIFCWQALLKIVNNTISKSNAGIACIFANATIVNTTVKSSMWSGVYCSYSNLTVTNGNVSKNDWGFQCWSSNLTIIDGRILEQYFGIEADSCNVTIIDSNISNNCIGICSHDYFSRGRSNVTVINTTISGQTYGGWNIAVYQTDLIVKNTTISGGTTYDFYLGSTSKVECINTTFTKSKIHFDDTYSILNVSWYLCVKVVDQYNMPVEDANVTVYNATNHKIFNGSTDENGEIKWIEVQEYMNQGDTVTKYTPHNITATKGNYSEFKIANIDRSKEIIIAPNRAPVIDSYSPLTNPTITEEQSQVFSVAASDPDADVLTITWYLNNNLVTTGDSYTFIANYTSAGWYEVKVIVSDGNLSTNRTWILTVTNVNRAPVIESYSPLTNPTISEDQSQIFTISATDLDNDVLSVYWYLNDTLKVTGTSYTFVANYTSAGWYEIKVIVSDGNLSVNHTWILTVTNVNRVPVIESYSPLTNPTITEEQNQLFTVSASDPDGESLTIEWFLNNSLIATGNSYTFIGNYTSAGWCSVKVVVSDGELSAEHSWILTVTNVNRPPVIEMIGDKTAYEGQVFNLQISATDPDNDTLTFADTTTLFYINPMTGLISFTPDYDSAGIYFINITVTDETDVVWQIFKLTIINVNRAPVINSTSPAPNPTINEGQSQTFSIDAYDPDGSIPEITWKLDDTIVGFNTSYSFSTNYTSSGQHIINATVTDGEYLRYYQWTVTVNNVNQAPTAVITSPAQNAKFSTNDNIYFDATGSLDLDNDVLTYTWTSSIDGNIGYAKTFYGKLSAGTHTITLAVGDGTDTDYEQIIITVEPPPAPKEEPKGFIPGFEAFLLLIVLTGCAGIGIKRRKKALPPEQPAGK